MENQQSVGTTYSLIHELGHGSMGVTYEAEDNSTHARIALKLINVPANNNPNYVKDLLEILNSDIAILSQINHPNIAQLYGTGIHDGRPYIARELCSGTTLREYFKFERVLPHPKAEKIALNMLSALEAIHKAGIVHGNINPENIMLSRDGEVKFMDFGITELENKPGNITGVIEYMPPEQIAGHTVDQRSDIFSLGAVIYEYMTGQKAVSTVTTTEMPQSTTQPEPDPTVYVPAIWDGILRKALATDPGLRYQSAAQMMEDVTANRTPASTRPPDAAPPQLENQPPDSTSIQLVDEMPDDSQIPIFNPQAPVDGLAVFRKYFSMVFNIISLIAAVLIILRKQTAENTPHLLAFIVILIMIVVTVVQLSKWRNR